MNRSTIILGTLVGLLGLGLVASVVTRPEPGLNASEVRTLVDEMMGEDASLSVAMSAPIEPATLHPMIESYLMANPSILERMSDALRAEARAEQIEQSRVAIAAMQSEIYDDPNHVVLGNPDGDVTLVEMFDYNCGYCRSALPDLATLLAEDPNLKVILKEFPILSQDSMDAARIGVAVSMEGGNYWDFHQILFTGRGQVTGQAALAAAEQIGLNPIAVELRSHDEEVEAAIQRSYTLAQTLGVTGTPAYIIGEEVIPGAIGVDGLRERIANMRACGKSQCSS